MYSARAIFAALLLALVCAAGRSALAQPSNPQAELDQYAVAAGVYSQSRWDEAVEEFKTYLRLYPEGEKAADVAFYLGEALVQLHRYDEAQVAFEDLLQRDQEHRFAGQARFRVGEIAYLAGDLDKAREQLDRFQKLKPFDPLLAFALPYLGDIALANNDASKAEALYSESLERFADGPLADHARFGLGKALELAGQPEQALRFYELLTADASQPLADDAQLQIGILHYEAQKYPLAEVALVRLTEDYDDSDLSVHGLYWLGMALIAQEKWTEAAETLLAAAKDNDEHRLAAAIHFAAGEALQKSGDDEAAAAEFRWVSQNQPDSDWADDALQSLVSIAFRQTRYEEVYALAVDFERRFADSPLAPLVRQLDGHALLKQEKFADAVARFENLLNISEPLPDAPPVGFRADEITTANFYYLALANLGERNYRNVLAALNRVRPSLRQADLEAGILVARASALVGLQRYREAIPPLREYLQHTPEGPDAPRCRAQLAVALAAMGELEAASAEYAALQTSHPGHRLLAPTAEYLAEAAYAKGDHARARQYFQQLADVRKQGAPRTKGMSGLAWSELVSGDAERAEKLLAQLLKDDPDNAEAAQWALLHGRALEKLQQNEAALAAYQLVAEKYADSAQCEIAMFDAARLHERLQQYEQAVAAWRAFVERFGESANVDGALYSLAWALNDLGREDESDAVFARIADEHKESEYYSDAVYRLAERAARFGRHEQAERWTARLLAADVEDSIRLRALYLQGQVAAAQEKWSDAAPPMEQLLASYPQSELALPAKYWLAEAAYRQGKYDEAGPLFAELAAQAMNQQQSWVAMIPLRRAQIFAQERRWTEALELAEQIEQQYPEFRLQYEADYLLGRCHASQAKFDAARAAYQRVVDSPAGGATETAAMAQWMIGETYLMQKHYDEAIGAYRRVEQLFDYPQWQAAALLQTAKCREKKQEWGEAARAYAQILEKFPDTEVAADAARLAPIARQRAASSVRSIDKQ